MSDAPKTCEGVSERIELTAGASFTSATGLIAHFEGASHDQYADGSTDLLLSLSFATEALASESWLPSALARSDPQVIHGHCVAVVEGSEQRVILSVAPVAVAEPPPTCVDPTSPRLEDYARVSDGARFHVDVRRDASSGEWLPTPLPKMPHHHATRLAWLNLAEHPGLAAARADALRFDFEVVSHTIQQAGTEHRWRAEYRARISTVCRFGPR